MPLSFRRFLFLLLLLLLLLLPSLPHPPPQHPSPFLPPFLPFLPRFLLSSSLEQRRQLEPECFYSYCCYRPHGGREGGREGGQQQQEAGDD